MSGSFTRSVFLLRLVLHVKPPHRRPPGPGGESVPEAELRPGDVREETRQPEEARRQTDQTGAASSSQA